MFSEISYTKILKLMWIIQWKNYWKGTINLVLGWLITLLTLFGWLQFKQIHLDNPEATVIGYDPFIFASGIGIMTIRCSLYNVYRVLYSLKKDKVFDRLFQTPISKKFVFLCVIVFNFFINLMIAVFLFAFTMLYSAERNRLANVNWPMFLSGYLLLILFCNALAFVFAFGTKSFEHPLVIISTLYFVAVYILGLGIPYSLMLNMNASNIALAKFVYYLDYFVPVKYMLNIMQAGWVGWNNMQFFPQANGNFFYTDGFGYAYKTWIPYLASIGIIFSLMLYMFGIAIKKYQVGSKKISKYVLNRIRFENIYMIKKCRNIKELQKIKELIAIREKEFKVKKHHEK